MMKRTLFLCLFALLLPVARGQSKSLIPYIPTSPQAEVFRRVGEYTVNNSSGIPDISIPLYEINHFGYKIPLALRYLASPVKPGYNYDVYGFGWSLTPGCCISRTIESLPDEVKDFKLSVDKLDTHYYLYPDFSVYENWMLDRYTATLPDGSSFEFAMEKDKSGNFRFTVSGGRQVKIRCIGGTGGIQSFTVTDEQGVKYFFDIAEQAFAAPGTYFSGCKVSWYLSRIELPHSDLPITFSYAFAIKTQWVHGYDEPVVLFSNYCVGGGNHIIDVKRESGGTNIYYQMRLLSGISYGDTHINVLYQKTDNEAIRNYAKGIEVREGGELRRRFRMTYRHQTIYRRRLESLSSLTRLVVSGREQSTDSLVYKLNYSHVNTTLGGTDHWGYCNANGTPYNVARFNFFVDFDTERVSNFTLTNLLCKLKKDAYDLCPYWKLCMQQNTMRDSREASHPNEHGVLTSIVYPTGGCTKFEFENHRFITATDDRGNYMHHNKRRAIIEGGGFRIRRIENHTADGKMAGVWNYRYGHTRAQLQAAGDRFPYGDANVSEEHTGYGLPVVDPNVLTYTDKVSSFPLMPSLAYMLTGLSPQGRYEPFSNPFTFYNINGGLPDPVGGRYRWECRFSALNFRRLLNGRTAVVYPVIAIYQGEIGENDEGIAEKTLGKSTYTYKISNAEMGNDTVSLWAPAVYGNALACDEKKHLQNNLLEKKEYVFHDGAFRIVSKEEYQRMYYAAGWVDDYIYTNEYVPGVYPDYETIRSSFGMRQTAYGCLKLMLKNTTLYRGVAGVTTREIYNYNGRLHLKKLITYGTKTVETDFFYPDTSATAAEVERKMVERNLLSPVLKSFSLSRSATAVPVGGYRVEYGEFASGNRSLILPKRLYRAKVDVSSEQFDEEEHVLAYSSNGNPKEIVKRDGLHTVYLWGYGDRYLIATIANATSEQVGRAVQAVFGTSVDGLAAMAPDVARLRALQTSTLLAGAQVTTYTHLPLAGVTSVTKPSGDAAYYEYDGLDRLKEVYRYEGNIVSEANRRVVKQYSYHTITH